MQPVASSIKKSGPLHDATTIPTTTRGNCVCNPTAAEDRAAGTFAFNERSCNHVSRCLGKDVTSQVARYSSGPKADRVGARVSRLLAIAFSDLSPPVCRLLFECHGSSLQTPFGATTRISRRRRRWREAPILPSRRRRTPLRPLLKPPPGTSLRKAQTRCCRSMSKQAETLSMPRQAETLT